ncbi:MAG: DUF6483 family protein [Chloroflexi bacterium]|nr:DUF6483 family protein [Chloroflexota bacterium]
MPAYSQDYIKRMLEQLGEVWAEVVGLLTKGDDAAALERIDQAYRDLVHLDRDLVHQTGEDFLILAVTVGRVGDIDRSLALCDLLRLEAQIHQKAGDEDMREQCLLKALNVLLEAALRLSHGSSQLHIERIDALLEETRVFDLPVSTLWRIFSYHEMRGRFAEAEDAMGHMLDLDEAAFAPHALEFYERLLGLPDHELERGGLPRAEVVAGMEGVESQSKE